jgi:hypothetical protein
MVEGGEQDNQNGLNRIAIIGRGYLILREENLSFNTNYLLNTKSVIFHLYHGENELSVDDKNICFVKDQHTEIP